MEAEVAVPEEVGARAAGERSSRLLRRTATRRGQERARGGLRVGEEAYTHHTGRGLVAGIRLNWPLELRRRINLKDSSGKSKRGEHRLLVITRTTLSPGA